jgi:hypothetical protein
VINTINLLETVKGFTKLCILKFLLNDDKFRLFLRHTYIEGGGDLGEGGISCTPGNKKKVLGSQNLKNIFIGSRYIKV